MIAFFIGVVVGIILTIGYNHYFPNKFDKITKDAATKVKDL